MTEDYERIRLEGLAAMYGRKLDGSPLQTPKGLGALQRWREENPDALQTWEMEDGRGCVVQFWGMRVYYGRCTECSGLVTRRRRLHETQKRRTFMGRWPKYCDECRKARRAATRAADAVKARKRMNQLRDDRRLDRDTILAGAGLPPIRQGVGVPTTEDNRKALERAARERAEALALQADSRGVFDPYENGL